MKTITLLAMMVALSSVTAFAQKEVIQRPWQGKVHDQGLTIKCIDRKAQPAMRMAKQFTTEDVLGPHLLQPLSRPGTPQAANSTLASSLV